VSQFNQFRIKKVFFGMWEVQDEWGKSKIHTFLLAMQVGFTHLLCSQRDKITFFVGHPLLYIKIA
jgi:hypothetical protein